MVLFAGLFVSIEHLVFILHIINLHLFYQLRVYLLGGLEWLFAGFDGVCIELA